MLPFKSFIQLDERVLIAKDMDMTLGHGNARVQLKHPTENRVMTNSEVMNEIPSQHLDSSLHQERTSSPHSPFRFTDQEFNTVVGKKPEYNKNNRWDFSEHQAAEGMEGFEFFPKAVRGLKKISSMAPEKVKSIIMTARSDLVSKTPGKTPQDIISSAFHKKTGIRVSRARMSVEILVFLLGWILGGTVGLGTALFALLIGNSVALGFKFVSIFSSQSE